jgi:hypothetical protein
MYKVEYIRAGDYREPIHQETYEEALKSVAIGLISGSG